MYYSSSIMHITYLDKHLFRLVSSFKSQKGLTHDLYRRKNRRYFYDCI